MLDPKGRKQIMGIIHQLHGEGITCILITHFMEEAAQAERILILNDGEIYMDGTPREIFTDRESLSALGLYVPMAVDLSYQLNDLGIHLPAGIVEEEELIDALCRLK